MESVIDLKIQQIIKGVNDLLKSGLQEEKDETMKVSDEYNIFGEEQMPMD